MTIEDIEAAVVRCGSLTAAAAELGVNKVTLNARLRREFGRGQSGDQAAAGVLLTRVVDMIGAEAAADELGTEVDHVERWAQWRRIPGSARRAILRLAERHGIASGH